MSSAVSAGQRGGQSPPPVPRRPNALELLGFGVHDVDGPDILAFIGDVVDQRGQATVLHVNVHAANLACDHPWFRDVLNGAQLVFCDGDGIRLGCRILGLRPPPKVTYNVWLWQLAAWCERQGRSLYLLGGRPGTAPRAAARLTARHPGLRIVGTHHGFFDKEGSENDELVAAIGRVQPDVLLVCFGMPAQERWVAAHAERLRVHVLLTGGAALDYAAGDVPIAPAPMVRLHAEWLYRLYLEPVRLFSRYVFGNPVFLARVLGLRLWHCRGRG